MLRLDPWTGAHLGFPSLVEGHVPLATAPVVPVDDRGVRVVAVLLETLPELAVLTEPFLEKQKWRNKNVTTLLISSLIGTDCNWVQVLLRPPTGTLLSWGTCGPGPVCCHVT